jgi:DNA (cytosine-5)-methyltransferase 1
LIAYDLFCGAGGASLGLHQAGYDVLGFDNWELAVESHIANGLPAILADLTIHDWSVYATPDLLWASPPCQPFSAAGKQLGPDDKRDCVPDFIFAARALGRPPVLVMENVQGLTFKKHEEYLGWVLLMLEDLGYAVEWKVLNAADYGVPQTRKRFILIARNDGVAIKWPDPTHSKNGNDLKPWVTMAEALGWGFGDGPARAICGNRRPRWCYEGPGRTIGTTVGHVGGKQTGGHINLSLEEAATLQGFPAGFVFLGNVTQRSRLVGNAVPPPLARAIVEGL